MKTVKPKIRMALRVVLAAMILVLMFSGCARTQPWPDSPLYEWPRPTAFEGSPQDRQSAMEAIEGRYAHYDVVSYEDPDTQTPMNTFVISYGFTEFRIEGDKLLQIDTFCSASHKINQKTISSKFSDAAVQAIKPRIQEVELSLEGGVWKIRRPESPVLLGIQGDPSLPLSRDPHDPDLTDPDNDGHPGVTVEINIGGVIQGEIYITRREIYRTELSLYPDGALRGHVIDTSEQFVVDADRKILRQSSNNTQLPDPGMNPLILIPIPDEIDTCAELMQNRDSYFPPEPDFE